MRGRPAPIFRKARDLVRHMGENARGVVLANGCFDPLHVGHIRYLHGAAACGDCLVVAVNDDASTRALKGRGRPVLTDVDRAELVAQLEMVDAVLIFAAPDVAEILETLRPAYHAKGTDYTVETVPEREVAKRLGIATVIVGDPKTHASRDIVDRIRTRTANEEGK